MWANKFHSLRDCVSVEFDFTSDLAARISFCTSNVNGLMAEIGVHKQTDGFSEAVVSLIMCFLSIIITAHF